MIMIKNVTKIRHIFAVLLILKFRRVSDSINRDAVKKSISLLMNRTRFCILISGYIQRFIIHA